MFKKILFVSALSLLPLVLPAQKMVSKNPIKPLVEAVDTFQRSTPQQMRDAFQTIDSLYQKETNRDRKMQLMQELFEALSDNFMFEGADKPMTPWQNGLYNILEDHAKAMQQTKNSAQKAKQAETFRLALEKYLFPAQA